MSKKQKLLAFICEVTTEVMDVDNNLSEVLSLDNYQPSEFLFKLCWKVSRADFKTIYWYYEFGLAITIHLNELIENGQKKMREMLNNEVLSYFFYFLPQTTLAIEWKRVEICMTFLVL